MFRRSKLCLSDARNRTASGTCPTLVRRLLASLWILSACGSAHEPPSSTTQPSARSAEGSKVAATRAEPWRAKAAGYLDGRVKSWLASPPQVANIDCALSCHTTFPAVLVQSHLPAGRTPHIDDARHRFEARLEGAPTPWYGRDGDAKTRESHATEAVLVATALTYDDAPRPTADSALQRMWSRQRPDGGWAWLDFGLEPWEHEDAFGVAMAALAAGSVDAPDTDGAARLRSQARRSATSASLHDQAALLWASSRFEGLLPDAEADAIAKALAATQAADGGTALADLFDVSAPEESDGYATAWATLALCASGRQLEAARAGQRWLRSHQERDGSWPGRSLNGKGRTARRYMTDAATAYAVLALDCDAS